MTQLACRTLRLLPSTSDPPAILDFVTTLQQKAVREESLCSSTGSSQILYPRTLLLHFDLEFPWNCHPSRRSSWILLECFPRACSPLDMLTFSCCTLSAPCFLSILVPGCTAALLKHSTESCFHQRCHLCHWKSHEPRHLSFSGCNAKISSACDCHFYNPTPQESCNSTFACCCQSYDQELQPQVYCQMNL